MASGFLSGFWSRGVKMDYWGAKLEVKLWIPRTSKICSIVQSTMEHANAGGSRGMPSQENFKNRCSEIESEAI